MSVPWLPLSAVGTELVCAEMCHGGKCNLLQNSVWKRNDDHLSVPDINCILKYFRFGAVDMFTTKVSLPLSFHVATRKF